MKIKNISFKKLITKGLLLIAPLLSLLMEGILALGSMVYKLLRYCLKYTWYALVLLLIGIPYLFYKLFSGKREGKQPRTYKFYLKWAGIAVGAGVAMLLLLFSLVYFGAFGKLPTEQELKELRQAEASLIYDDRGEFLGKFYIFDRTKVEYSDFPPYLVNALISTEDERFYSHSGVDMRSLFRVFFKTLLRKTLNARA